MDMEDMEDENNDRIVELTRELIRKGLLIDQLSDKIHDLENTQDRNREASSNSVPDEGKMRLLELQHNVDKYKLSFRKTSRVLALEKEGHQEVRTLLASLQTEYKSFKHEMLERVATQIKTTEKLNEEKLAQRSSTLVKVELKNSHLAQEILNSSKAHAEISAELEEALSSMQSLKNSGRSDRSNLNALENELIARTKKLGETQVELKNVQLELSNTKSELSTTETELSSAQTELSGTQTVISNTQTELSNTKTELSNARGSAATAAETRERQLSQLTDNLNVSETQVAKLTVEVNQSNDENTNIENRLTAANKKIVDLNDLLSQNDSFGTDLGNMKNVVAELSERLEHSRSKESAANAKNLEITGLNQQQKIVITNLTNEAIEVDKLRAIEVDKQRKDLASFTKDAQDKDKDNDEKIGIIQHELDNVINMNTTLRSQLGTCQTELEKNVRGQLSNNNELDELRVKYDKLEKQSAADILNLQATTHRACEERGELQKKLQKLSHPHPPTELQYDVVDENNGANNIDNDNDNDNDAKSAWATSNRGRGGNTRGRRKTGRMS